MKQNGIDSFVNQRIWIIGASSGIGEACTQAFIKAGAKVALSSRRVERLNAIAQSAEPGQSLVLPLDVTQEDQLCSAYQDILEAWGGLDLLLFVSGVYTPLRADNFEFAIAQKTIDANLLGRIYKFKGCVKVSVIGHGHGRHVHLSGCLHQVIDTSGAIED